MEDGIFSVLTFHSVMKHNVLLYDTAVRLLGELEATGRTLLGL